MVAGMSLLYNEVLPFTVIVALECTNVGLNTVFKAAIDRGLSFYVFVTYTYAIITLILLPSPFIYRKSTVLPPLTARIIGKEGLLGVFGSVALMSGYKGIEYGSPTLASAMSNLIPAFTFILAIIVRMENFAWRSSSSQAKAIGTVVSITGAMIVILYKGPSIVLFSSRSSSTSAGNFLQSSNSKWIIGGVFLGFDYIITPALYIVQAQILKEYPAEFVLIFFFNLFAVIFSGAISFVAEPDWAAWTLKLDISLAAIIYSGLTGCLYGCAYAWIVLWKGPVYFAMFKPLSIAIAAAMGVIFLGDTLHVGSIIGAVVISIGFYTVMWGKATEENREEFSSAADRELSPERAPLLRSSEAENT